jgi:serine/threonine protein kinase
MRQERWQRIDELFHGALQLAGDQRAAYLHESCSDDEALRLELERLLIRHAEAESFLESPALEFIAHHVDSNRQTPDLEGVVVSHYRVIRKIGSGGMGVVYEGEDLRLKRRVALKFLPGNRSRDREAVERFEAEAQAASSLNHPNICTIYEVEEHEGQPAIVMELLEGQNLRQRIQADRVSAGELIQREFDVILL